VRRVWAFLLIASSCSNAATASSRGGNIPIATSNEAPVKKAEQQRTAVPDSGPVLTIIYYPALGISGWVKFYRTDSGWRIWTARSARRGIAATWTVDYRGEAAERLTRQVAQVPRDTHAAHACPEFSGRDGTTWSAHYGPSEAERFSLPVYPRGEESCERVKQRLHWLMQAGRLNCSARSCLRPEEIETRRFTCADGNAGRECREQGIVIR